MNSPPINEVFYDLNAATNSKIFSFSNQSSNVLIRTSLVSPIITFNNTSYNEFINSNTTNYSSFSFQIKGNSEFSFKSHFNHNGTIRFNLNGGDDYMKITSLYGGEFTYIDVNYSSHITGYQYHYFETIGNTSLMSNSNNITFIILNKLLVIEINRDIIFSGFIPNLGSSINVALSTKEVEANDFNFHQRTTLCYYHKL